ncbi:MAG: hypothetical protein CMN72_06525 [Sphingomonas sp.]|nr:hypothetical protein [Sphingomonas sp.]
MFDWLGRTLLLILSGLATFAVLLSLQSASQVDMGERTANAPVSAPSPDTPDSAEGGGRQLNRESQPYGDAPAPSPPGEPAQIRGPAGPERETAKWLRAATYALLALTGFVAAGLIVLLKITSILSRIADRRD